MPTLFQKLRQRFKQALDYSQEHGYAANLGRLTTAGGFLIVVALVVVGLFAVWLVPQWQVDRYLDLQHELTLPKQLELEDAYRKTITQIVLGVFGLFLLYFTWRRSVAGDKSVRIAEQGHITDRFTKAIEQLGKTDNGVPNIEVRLGAIYALERIAFDSPRDHWTIMEILTAYVRQNAPLQGLQERPRTDIQAILTVLGRRRTGPDRENESQRLDLSNSHLAGANLREANLQRVLLDNTNLQGAGLLQANLQFASMDKADLRGAYLANADLRRTIIQISLMQEANLNFADLRGTEFRMVEMQSAYLQYADLRNAAFYSSDLRDANLYRANLEGTSLDGVVLQGTVLTEANLKGANDMKVDQIKTATFWERAHYSPAFRTELGLPPEDNA